MNILVLGAGTFGTAIANELSINSKNNVILFSNNTERVKEINIKNSNKSCFPNKSLNYKLKATSDVNDLIKADVILIALPSQVVLDKLQSLKPYFNEKALFVNLSKGILQGGITIVESIQQKLSIQNVVSLKGPSFAVEIIEHANTILTLGYSSKDQYLIIKKILKNTALYIDHTKDVRGVELLSVLKNIYAVVIGIIDAKYNSPNTRFMILTKGFSEIRLLLKILNGVEDTVFLSCGFGDLCLTSLNDLSRNRTLGLLIGKGFFNSNYESNTVILEGLRSIKIIHSLLNNDYINDLPIFYKLHNYFLNDEKNLDFKFKDLIKS